MRITCSAPEAMISDANNLAMCLAFGPADGLTYRGLNWEDADGNLYAAAGWEAQEAWIEFALAPLVRPAWDTDEIIDMVAAERAQAALVYSTVPVPATPTALTAIAGMESLSALAASGLTGVPQDG